MGMLPLEESQMKTQQSHLTPLAGADKTRSGLAVPLAGFVKLPVPVAHHQALA